MKKLFAIIFLIILPVCSFASEKPVWVEATGEAYLGEIDTPKEVKERARRDAQKNALEKAVGVFHLVPKLLRGNAYRCQLFIQCSFN